MLNRRSGFSLAEIAVTIAILAILAAIIVSQVVGRVNDGKGAAIAQTLSAISDAVLDYRADIRRYPRRLQHLTTAPVAGTRDLCNQNVPSVFLSRWRGPYLKQTVTSSGLAIAETTVRDSLEQDPAGPYTSTSNGTVVVVVENVDSTIASRLEAAFDGNATFASGNIRFTPGSSAKGTLRYAVPVRGC